MVPPPSSAIAPPPARRLAPSAPPEPGPAAASAAAAERARQLFEQHHREVLRFLRRRDQDLAEDALSETFAVAVRRAADIPDGKELPWLYVVADHVLRNLQRSRRRAARIPEALHPFTRHTTDAPGLPYVGEALAELPDRERLLLTLTAFEGLSAAEAADRIGVPYGSARNALSSGRKRLAVVLASAAVLILVLGVAFGALFTQQRQDAPLQTLASSLSQARVVHDVAVVRHERRGPAAAPSGNDARTAAAGGGSAGAADAGARYERWSDQAGDRTRVRLPGGEVVVAGRGETLRAAARDDAGPSTPARRRAVREDLAALDAASPGAIAALLATPAAQRTAADGPTIAGRDTTTVRGRITDAAGKEHAVRVFVADDAPTVLRVRVRRILDGGRATAAGLAAATRAAVSADAATVDFVAWTAVPQDGPDAGKTPPAIPAAPASPGAAAATGAGTEAGAAGAGGRGRRDNDEQAPTRGADRDDDTAAGSSVARGGASTAPAPAATSKLATASIVHVRQHVLACSSGAPAAGASNCINFGDREVWLELTGQQRSRSRAWRSSGELKNEEWIVPGTRSYYNVVPGREQINARRERITREGSTNRAPVPLQWRGAWLQGVTRAIAELQGAPSKLAALPPGPELGGTATRLLTTTVQGGMAWDGGPAAVAADIAVDPATGTPRQVRYHRDWGAGSEEVTVQITAWELIPAGDHAGLVTRDFPTGARVIEATY